MVSFEDIELFFALTCYSKHKYSIKLKEHLRGSLYYSLGGCTQFCKNFNFFEFFKNSPKVIETLNFASILNYLLPMGLKLSQTYYSTFRQYLGVMPHFWKIDIFSLVVKKKIQMMIFMVKTYASVWAESIEKKISSTAVEMVPNR